MRGSWLPWVRRAGPSPTLDAAGTRRRSGRLKDLHGTVNPAAESVNARETKGLEFGGPPGSGVPVGSFSRKEPEMIPILAFPLLLLTADPPDSPWVEVRLTIFRDPYSSSDQVTVCRVRADNLGGSDVVGPGARLRGPRGRRRPARPGAGPLRPRARAPRLARDPRLAARPPRPLRGRPDHAEGLLGGPGAEGAAQALAPPPEAAGLTARGR